jgi:hypothetical protein
LQGSLTEYSKEVNRILRRASRDLVKFISTLGNDLPAILEQDMANIQGKGAGVESVHSEVRSVLKFYTPPPSKIIRLIC